MFFQEESAHFCPYCGEAILLMIDPTVAEQSYYEDCAVCCAPMFIVISEDDFGEIQVVVRRDDE